MMQSFYHHRLLLARVSGAVWIAADPDLLVARVDLEEEQHLVIARNALFPDICLQDDTGLLCFDPLSDAQLRRCYAAVMRNSERFVLNRQLEMAKATLVTVRKRLAAVRGRAHADEGAGADNVLDTNRLD